MKLSHSEVLFQQELTAVTAAFYDTLQDKPVDAKKAKKVLMQRIADLRYLATRMSRPKSHLFNC